MNAVNAKVGLAGRYQLVVGKLDADGNEVPGSRHVVVPWFDNLITDGGLDQLGSGSFNVDQIGYCRIGTGNTAPANTDTGLVAQVGSTNSAGIGGYSGLSVDGTYIYRRVSKRFNPGTVSGVNLAEVAMAPAATGQVFSRSLIKDTGGSPTTITLASDEYLDVVYELRIYLPDNDQTVSTTIDGAANTVTIRRSTQGQQVANWAAVVGYPFSYKNIQNDFYSRYCLDGVENIPDASSGWDYNESLRGALTDIPYVNGTHQKSYTVVFGPPLDNYGTGLGALLIGTANTNNNANCSFGPWAFGFSPKLNKTNTRKATITVGVTWGRYP